MGDILAFPSRSTKLAKQNQCCGIENIESRAAEFAILINAQSRIVKALLLSLASLESALAALAKTLRDLPAGDCRERLLKQQTALVVMIYQAQRLLTEHELPGSDERRGYEAPVRFDIYNSVHELD